MIIKLPNHDKYFLGLPDFFVSVMKYIYQRLPFHIEMVRPHLRYIYVDNINNNHGLVGCEIGVQRGYNAKNLLKYLKIKKLYLVDPYKAFTFDNGVHFSKYKQNMIRSQAKILLRKYKHKISWIYKDSDDVNIDEKLDFIYIDGNHEYNAVLSDLKHFYPMVKKEGIISGHDIDYLNVSRAIFDYTSEKNIDVMFNRKDWWFKK